MKLLTPRPFYSTLGAFMKVLIVKFKILFTLEDIDLRKFPYKPTVLYLLLKYMGTPSFIIIPNFQDITPFSESLVGYHTLYTLSMLE